MFGQGIRPAKGRRAGRLARGFTMLEMIMVISIMLFLLAMMAYFVGSAYSASQIKSTQETINAIESGLLNYYETKGEFPTLTADGDALQWSPAVSLYKALVEDTGSMSNIPQGATATTLESTPRKYFTDAWRNPILAVVFDRGSVAANSNGGMPFIYSWGPDGQGWSTQTVKGQSSLRSMIESGTKTTDGDNITNFRDIDW